MRYLMLVCVEPGVSEADRAAAPDIDDWLDDVASVRVVGNELQGLGTAKTVRVRGGQTLVTDGPFTESKEWIAGFDILEVPDLDA
ncbi:MAG: YciI family protein, partial [Candidatus Limnocylindrales bacterium]